MPLDELFEAALAVPADDVIMDRMQERAERRRTAADMVVKLKDKLKEKGVELYFQKENIFTFDSKGELLITIMSSLAQEESRSISENVTCRI